MNHWRFYLKPPLEPLIVLGNECYEGKVGGCYLCIKVFSDPFVSGSLSNFSEIGLFC